MKVCIYGAGAIGAHIGVLMKLAGVDVSLCEFSQSRTLQVSCRAKEGA